MGLTSYLAKALHLSNIKLIGILIILCKLANQNNSNYIPLMITLYLYFAGAKVDAITFLNYFGLLVFYNVLQKQLKNTNFASQALIK